MTRPTIRLEDRLSYLTPVRTVPPVPSRRSPTLLPRGVGEQHAPGRVGAPAARVRALRSVRRLDPWRAVDALGAATGGDLGLVVLALGSAFSVALGLAVRAVLLGGAA